MTHFFAAAKSCCSHNYHVHLQFFCHFNYLCSRVSKLDHPLIVSCQLGEHNASKYSSSLLLYCSSKLVIHRFLIFVSPFYDIQDSYHHFIMEVTVAAASVVDVCSVIKRS